ncbi:SAM hydrolase/SAM-dependent halogenase family protein [Sulfurirhabdus autotrophica]|uniref:SAM-dependent chlorinase/fluorinase n=1 Tax=Sulfurirhabdus autotrophica TaxID=1706046 RepID=A0A4R3XVL5_9PROT|nr:SAM-dependent chlorinase/fluorinase [Sulfurirhabdus autotrophica]TCV83775.1 hypothetical protein EDC63_11485 [Sulfurirhabdus autotrophica]
MIALFSDFGSADIYVGQIKMVLSKLAPEVVVNDLFHDAPNFDVVSSAHLLSALSVNFPPGSVFLSVIDPGVGSSRGAVVILVDSWWFVGPDNGLMSVVAARHSNVKYWRINWRPEHFSQSFHGRDLFAPIAAWIAKGEFPSDKLESMTELSVNFSENDAFSIIYIDHYGNSFTGIRAVNLAFDREILINGVAVRYANTFSTVEVGHVFWYVNSLELVEIAVNCGSAASLLNLRVGTELTII